MRPASPAAWSAKDARGRTCDPRGQRRPRRGIHWAQAVGSRRCRRAVREVSTASHNHVPFRNHADAGEHPPTPNLPGLPPPRCALRQCSPFLPCSQRRGATRTYVTSCSVERETRICRPVLTPLRGGRGGGRRPVRRRSLGVQCYMIARFVLQKLSKELEGKDNGLQMTLAPSMVETAGFAKCRHSQRSPYRSRDIVLRGEGRLPADR